jgi:GntR family transcriptional regulator
MTDESLHPLKANRLSLSAQAQQYLLDLIKAGTYQPGEQFPSESDLAVQLGISRPTLREALLNLEQEGIIIRRHGVGTFVAPGYGHRLEGGLERLESILELAARQGLQVRCEALNMKQVLADEELATRLEIAPDTQVTSVRRTIMVDGRPVAYMLDLVPASVLSPADVDQSFNGSVLDLLKQKQELHIAQATADIIALNADASLAKKLKVEIGQAVLLLEELLYDIEGMPVEFSQNYFIPEYFRFRVVRR